MVDKAHKSALLVLTDRTTLLTKVKKSHPKRPSPWIETMIRQLDHIPQGFLNP